MDRPDLDTLDDHDLLAGGVADGVAEARAAARRWARLVEFHRRREADARSREAVSPHFTLTPRAVTVTEVSALWGLSEQRVRHELNVALFLEQYFPTLWHWCLAGQLDAYRASVVADNVRHAVSDPFLLRVLADRVTAYLERHLSDAHGLPGVPPRRVVHAQAAAQQADLRDQPAASGRRRGAAPGRGGGAPGQGDRAARRHGSPGCHRDPRPGAAGRAPADARRPRAAQGGDERTVAQLRSDLAMDLLIGREEGVPVPRYARPVVNVTVPVQTLMGLGDAPGVMAGGTPIPAGLARVIAGRPGSTWYRLLTDPAGKVADLSTTSYRPTDPIWRRVVAEWSSCFEPACSAPATQVEIDHRIPWPIGRTEPGNLWPGCKRGHTAKHAPGFSVRQDPAGSFVLRTAAGFAHRIEPPAPPVDDEWPDLPGPAEGEVQFSATELLEALADVRLRRDSDLAEARELEWEHGTRLDQLVL